MGYGDLACYGSKDLQTPNLDAMALKGIKFLDYHSSGAVCSPTRAALMTGRYQQRSGIEGVVTAARHRIGGLSPNEGTLSDIASSEGYRTAMFGKWHLGYDTAHFPVKNGFDVFNGFVSGNIDYHSHIDQTGHYDWWDGTDSLFEEGYLTDLITEKAVAFIDNNANEQFFLYLAHGAPHYPYQGRLDKADRIVNGKVPVVGTRKDRAGAYIEMIQALDDGVGRVLAALERNNLSEKTFVFFCSDNGATPNVGSNGILRGAKSTLWEGGHRVPAIAYWPEKIESGINDDLILSMDLLPTIAQLIGIDSKNYTLPDGIDFSQQLFNPSTLPERTVYWRFNKFTAARKENWKYIKNKDQEYLFNLKTDLQEQNNLKDSEPEIFNILRNSMRDWEEEMSQYKYFTGR